MTEVRFRRWSDGIELAVRSFDDYKRLYNNGQYYIVSGEHATHTPEGVPLKKRVTKQSPPAERRNHANNETKHVPTQTNDEDAGNELSRPGDDQPTDVRE